MPEVKDTAELPHAYLLKKLQMVMPLFQEARDALCAITEAQRVARGISKSLGDRMDAAGTYSYADWEKENPQPVVGVEWAERYADRITPAVVQSAPTTEKQISADAYWNSWICLECKSGVKDVHLTTCSNFGRRSKE